VTQQDLIEPEIDLVVLQGPLTNCPIRQPQSKSAASRAASAALSRKRHSISFTALIGAPPTVPGLSAVLREGVNDILLLTIVVKVRTVPQINVNSDNIGEALSEHIGARIMHFEANSLMRVAPKSPLI
jgi:hypothetical protein